MTLDTFINSMNKRPYSESIEHEDFEFLYVRRSIKIINQDKRYDVLTIANIQAKKLGECAFTKLVNYLIERRVSIYMECVHNPRFAYYLLRIGFSKIDKNLGPNFFKDVRCQYSS